MRADITRTIKSGDARDEIHGMFECGDCARNSAHYAGDYDALCYTAPGAAEHLLEQYTYDNVGRLKTRVHVTQGQTSYDWDDRGYLIQVTRPGTVITYTYDALGQRKTKTVNGVTTRYVTAPIFGMSHVLMELDENNGIQRTYLYGGNQQLGEEPVATNRAADRYLLQGGSVGNITHAVNRAGVIENEYGYDAFGMRTNVTTTGASTRYGCTGEHYDEETGLLYLRARYYDPMIGRFISVDPYLGRLEEPDTQNRFVYVQNNPLSFVDPMGNAANFVIQAVYGFFSGGVGGAITAYAKNEDPREAILGFIVGGAAGAVVGVANPFASAAAGNLTAQALVTGGTAVVSSYAGQATGNIAVDYKYGEDIQPFKNISHAAALMSGPGGVFGFVGGLIIREGTMTASRYATAGSVEGVFTGGFEALGYYVDHVEYSAAGKYFNTGYSCR